MSQAFQIKYRGEVVWEATLAELQQQVARGQLTALHKLSHDGQQWRYASEFPELFGGTQATATANAPAQPSAAPAEPQWYVSSVDQPIGPFPRGEIARRIRAGEVSLQEKVWHEGLADWRPIPDEFPREAHEAWCQWQRAEFHRQKEAAHEAKREAKRQRLAAIPPEEISYSLLGIASLVFSLLWIGGLGSAAGVVLGVLGLYDILTNEGYRRGLIPTIIGIIVGFLGLGITVLLILAA